MFETYYMVHSVQQVNLTTHVYDLNASHIMDNDRTQIHSVTISEASTVRLLYRIARPG